jgi:hypothetical protein
MPTQATQQNQTPPVESGTSTPAQQTQNQSQPAGGKPATWDEILGGLPPEQKAAYDEHVKGLKNSVEATRGERDALNAKLKSLSGKTGKDPEVLQKELAELSTQVDAANKRIAFLEEAGKPENECRNPNAAWAIAQSQGLFRANGSPDWKSIREVLPEIFGKPVVNINAGTGAGPGVAKAGMNDWIRVQAAGRRG